MADSKDRKPIPHEIVFYTYPKLIFVWPVILTGFLFWLLGRWEWSNPEILAWAWAITLFLTMLTMGVDLSRNVAVFWGVVVIAIWLAVIYLRDVSGLTVFRSIYDFFAGLDPVYSPSLGLIVSITLSVPFLIMIVWSRINSRWRVTHNEFEHYSFGRADDSLARGAKRVRSEYPDLFEFLLLLAGDLVVFDAVGRRELRRIRHIPLLPFVRKRIGRILETTSVTTDAVLEEEQEAAAEEEHSV